MSTDKQLSLRAITAYVTVVEHNSIVKATEVLGQTPSAVSFSIDQVEAKFDASLFIRARDRDIATTPEGQQLADKFHVWLDSYQELMNSGRSMANDLSGTLRIGYDAPDAAAFLPRILRPMVQENPKFNLDLRMHDQDSAQEALLNGELDAAIYTEQDQHKGILTSELLRLPPYVLAPAGHAIGKTRPARLSTIVKYPLVVLDRPGTRAYFNSLFRAKKLDPNVLAYADSDEMVRGLIGARLGLGIMNISPFNNHSAGNDPLIAVPLEPGLPPISMVIGRAEGRPRRLVSDFVKRVQIAMKMDEMQTLIIS